MFEGQSQINADTVGNFFSEGEVVEAAVARLSEAGFEILQISPMSINFAGTAAQFRRAFKTDIVVEDRQVIKEGGQKDVAQFLDSPDTSLSGLVQTDGTNFADAIEGIALEEPRYPMASMFAPLKSYWHLRVPGDVSLACNADRAHRAGITGKGVKVAMVDSGWFKHPYFVGRGYKAAPVVLGPGTANPLRDESGHGTGESANIFANAPDIDFMPVKMSFVNSTGGFNAAVGLSPHIITCSWGSHHPQSTLSAADQVLAAAIAAAVASGIIVIFSAGNGHYGFPGMHPNVISAGGVFMNPNETLQASNYASSYPGNVYPGRNCPDVCGLVGMQPKALYIMLPVEPGDSIDATPVPGGLQGGTHPNGDETTNNDGWAAFSGTSAAAPQLAGVAALIKQACPGLTPAQVRTIMKNTARDVTTGNSNPVQGTPTFPAGHAAAAGVDIATGNGLVDAHKAIMVAKVTCLGPILPPITTPIITQPVITTPGVVTPPIITPPITTPIITTPIITTPVKPPILPPITPPIVVQPIKPGPVTTIQPVKPIAPIVNVGPVQPVPTADEASEAAPSASSALSAEDVESLSDLIINSDLSVD